MRPSLAHVVSFLSLFLALNVSAVVRYVDLNSLDPRPPYTNWATASTNIQVAIDAAASGDQVLVTNGIYAVGGRAVNGTMTNRVVLTGGVSLRSVNGPEFTIIQGRQVPGTTNGDGAIRCVYLSDPADISGFTLTGGATRATGNYAQERSGGGIWCSTHNPSVSNCVIVGNSATGNGGGAFYGDLTDCVLRDNWTTGNGGGASGGYLRNCRVLFNRATLGGGVHSSTRPGEHYSTFIQNCSVLGNLARDAGGGVNWSTLYQCTIVANRTVTGGGANESQLHYCILALNAANCGADYMGGSLEYCCATPLSTNGPGNIDVDPQLPDGVHLTATSPCRGAGVSHAWNVADLDQEKWINPPSIGCDEYWPGSATGMLAVAVRPSYSTVASGFPVHLTGDIWNSATVSVWDFGDGTAETNRIMTTRTWLVPGDYQVVLWAANDSIATGVSGTATVHVVEAPVHYVAPDSANPTPPYLSWETAATNIQDAIDACSVPGALILVTNGIYATGGRVANGTTTNRILINKPITVRSVNGPEHTVIRGHHVSGGASRSAVRCAYLAEGGCLSGFTLSEGGTSGYGDQITEGSGGALWCHSTNNVATNCVIANSVANYVGGGAYSGWLINCTIISNAASFGGGTAYSILNGCVVTKNHASTNGGGAHFGTLRNTILKANSAVQRGGGASFADLKTCFVTENVSEGTAGGMHSGTGDHCTIVGNTARTMGGGVVLSKLENSIAYFNNAPMQENVWNADLNYCCTTPLPTAGDSNTDADPELLDLPHLSPDSPVRGRAGSKTATDLDIDGEPWREVASIGCDENWPGSSTNRVSGAIHAPFTTVVVDWPLTFTGEITGRASRTVWEFGDGMALTNRLAVSHGWSTVGDYEVKFTTYNDTFPVGISTSVWVHVVPEAIHYVSASNPEAQPPFLSWATAAADIQSAVDVAVPGATILVTNGLYATGGRMHLVALTNRVVVDKPISIQSVNGPDVTVIRGTRVSGSSSQSARCVYLANGASLSGFTLTLGGALSVSAQPGANQGGGVLCESASAVISNCVITGNAALTEGAGTCFGTLYNCTITSNSTMNTSSAYGGGAYGSLLQNCTLLANSSVYGGGAYESLLQNCTLLGNSSTYGGGACGSTLANCLIQNNKSSGVYLSTAYNCIIRSNSALKSGGAWDSKLINCLLTDNYTQYDNGGAAYGGQLQNCTITGNRGMGVYGGTLQNCVVYSNFDGTTEVNYSTDTVLSYCCTIPKPKGIGNITNAPLFIDPDHGNFRLHPASPCINAGDNASVFSETDLDNNPRTFGDVVDIGAYEAQSPKMTVPQLMGMALENNSSFQLEFTNVTGVSFVVLTTTNLALPESSWSVISNGVVEWPTGSGHYQLIDSSATNRQQSYYRIRSP